MQANPRLRMRWPVMVAAMAIVMTAWWLWPRTPAELSEQGYDVTLALYRVCNQRSVEGLAQIEQELASMSASNPSLDSSQRLIADIVGQAKAGQWQAATIACRQALDDQVAATAGN